MAKITREQYLANKKFYDRRMDALQEQQKRLNKIVKGAKQEKGYFLKRAVVIKGDKARGLSDMLVSPGKKKGTIRIAGRAYPENGGDGNYMVETKSRFLRHGFFGSSAWQDSPSSYGPLSASEKKLLRRSGGGHGSSGHRGG